MPPPVVLQVMGALSGEALCTIRAERSWQVRTVKEELSRRVEGTPPAAQRLLSGDRCLLDSDKLGDILPKGATAAKFALVRAVAEAAAFRDIEDGRVDLEDLDEELRGNRDIVLAAVRGDGLALEYAAEDLRGDHEIVLTAVMESGAALRHASKQARGDKELVLAAVRQYGQALQYASEDLRSDWEVGTCALRSNWKALGFATEKLRGDREFMLAALRETRNPEIFRYLSGGLRLDKALFMASVVEHPLTFAYAASALQFDRNTVLDIVRANGRAVGFASDKVKHDAGVMAAALESAPDAKTWAWNYNSYAYRD